MHMSRRPQEAFSAAVRHFQSPPEAPVPVAVQPPQQAPREIVLLEAGLPVKTDFFGIPPADVEKNTAALFTADELAEMVALQARAEKFTLALAASAQMCQNPVKVAAELVRISREPLTEAELDHALAAPERRAIARAAAKASLRMIFKEEVRPLLQKIYARVSDHLKDVILCLIAQEKATFENLNKEITAGGYDFIFEPSKFVKSLVLRRIRLVEPLSELPHGLAEPVQYLKGIVNFTK